jgi:hypothetical protein
VSWAVRLLAAGSALAAVLAAVAGVSRGSGALAASLSGALLALLAQVAAVGLLRPAMGARTPAFMQRWVAGMAVRGASLLVLAGLIVLWRGSLPVLWMAVGYLGVLLPLLFVETRYLR